MGSAELKDSKIKYSSIFMAKQIVFFSVKQKKESDRTLKSNL